MRRSPTQTRPDFRHLRIYAIDPMVARAGEHQVTVQVHFERLEARSASFRGRRLEVVDVDASGSRAVWLKAVDLEDAHIAMQHGLEPSESDPQFHQQMVYAVAMRTLEQFDRALGRVVEFTGRRRLRLVPHAFRGSNAFYHPKLRAVLFGYFRASKDAPGENLPGQLIFTCLSHDIVAHEVTHAVVDRLRPYFNVATNPHVRAFHEGFADIVAVFQRLSFHDVVQRALQDARGDLRQRGLLSEIAAQFGEGLGSGRALRSALDVKTRIQDVREEHALGAVLVAAIFEGFYTTYERRTADLIRIATGGTGVLPQGALHPDLVARLTSECVRTAKSVLTMCIRAFEYLPPADVTFGAFLRALVTADSELNPLDEAGLRAAIIEACRRRGIYAVEAGSLAVSALLLDTATQKDWEPHEPTFRKWIDLALQMEVEAQRRGTFEDEAVEVDLDTTNAPTSTQDSWTEAEEEPLEYGKQLRQAIRDWFESLPSPDRVRLGLHPHPELKQRVQVNASRRVTADGSQRFGLVVQLVEVQPEVIAGDTRDVPTGATLVIDVTGQVRFVIATNAVHLRRDAIQETARLAITNAMGWEVMSPSANPLAVDFRGMHEART